MRQVTKMDFIGKWSFAAVDGNYVGIDPATAVLNASSKTAEANQKFNGYGTPDKFMLQAANGKYVVSSGDGYKAACGREDDVTWFSLEDAGDGGWRIVDLGIKGGGADRYYWDAQNGALKRIAKSATPPASTAFKQTIVTVGLAVFKEQGFPTPAPDLSWVFMAGQDLANTQRRVILMRTNLSNADLTGANLTGVTMKSADLTGAKLTGATISEMADLSDAILHGTDLSKSDLTDAVMNQADLTGACLNDAKMTGASLNRAILKQAEMQRVDLKGGIIYNADFTGANLTEATLTTANIQDINLTDANLTGAQLSNRNLDNPTINLANAIISSETNFHRATMRYVDLSSQNLERVDMAYADLTGCKMDKCILDNAEFAYTNLTDVTLTGNISMVGANFSNATLTGANMTGAQMGSISVLFKVTDSAEVGNFETALNSDDTSTAKEIFSSNGYPLSGSVVISPSAGAPGRVWEVVASGNTSYTVRKESTSAGDVMAVYQATTAAILANAFMKGTILTGANMYNVRAPGVQLYGGVKLDGGAILEGAQFDKANMGNINLKQANLYGVNFDYATLTGAQFQGANLSTSAAGGAATLLRANLQGANFSDATLDDAIFTDAAVSVYGNQEEKIVNGVYLFNNKSSQTLLDELESGSNTFNFNTELLNYLQQGPVTPQIQAAFQEKGVTISDAAIVSVQKYATYWQVRDGDNEYVIFQSCDDNQYQPALGVASGSDTSVTPQFFIPPYLEDQLKTGPVSNDVIAAFKAGGVTLSSAAKVEADQQASDWLLTDISSSYNLWRGLSKSCGLSLTARAAIPQLISVFSDHSSPLTLRATMRNTGDGRWQLDNDSDNPFNPIINYIRFNLINNTDSGNLEIYSQAIRMMRLSAAGTLEYVNIICDVTVLTKDELKPSTICPNSVRTSVNESGGLAFNEWMRANELPKAPFCVPSLDGTYYCPQTPPT